MFIVVVCSGMWGVVLNSGVDIWWKDWPKGVTVVDR